MPVDLAPIVKRLLAESERTKEVTLDAIGEAVGALPVSQADIESIMDALEKKGRRVVGPEGQHGEGRLRDVLSAARALRGELGRAPTVAEIASRSGLDEDAIRHALALARVMQR